jgi:predicted nucleotidyltransferase
MSTPEEERICALAREFPLDLLLLFGSRARGDVNPQSDWDCGYLAGPDFDPDEFLGRLVSLLGTDRIDLVDLRRTNGLLRYRAAAEGRPLFAVRPGVFEDFWLEAISFWCDMGPILRQGYEEILQGLAKS